MKKEKNPVRGYAALKWVMLALHLLAFACFVAGVSLIYCNANFKKGFFWMDEEAYEDSPAFSSVLEEQVDELFNYIRYRDVFQSAGELDPDSDLFALSTGTGMEEIWTLNDVLEYAEAHGYSFDNDYRVIRDESAPEGDGRTFPVTWRAYRRDQEITSPGDNFVSLDYMTREVLTCLGNFSRSNILFNTGSTNLLYRVSFEGRRLYTNNETLTADIARGYGRYAIFSSETLLPDNNLPVTPDEIVALIKDANTDTDDPQYEVIFAVDTKYPADDAFSRGRTEYSRRRGIYYYGMLLTMAGGAFLLLTMAVMILMSGHTAPRQKEITLYRFDRRMPERNVFLWAAACIILLFAADRTILLLLRMLLPENNWSFAGKMLAYVVVYLSALPLFFSLLRAFKAGILWENSLLKQLTAAASAFALDITFARRFFIYFSCFALFNVFAGILMAWLVCARKTLLSRVAVFVILVVLFIVDGWFCRKFMRKRAQSDRLVEAVQNLSSGTMAQLPLSEFEGREARLAATINNVNAGLQKALNDQVRSERMKAELITNVSHDIKTPLTSIINYVDLIKRAHPEDPKIQEYLAVLDQKSQHLKTLTEDLVEASKASTGNVQITAADIDFVELAYQTNGEFEERFAEKDLQLIANMPGDPVMIHADGQHLWRVLENLYNNAYKYAAPNSRVYVDLIREAGKARFTMKNISASPLNISPDELTERFVRGDVSRTTEGSGLGLSIAQSLTELQGGKFRIEIDGDYFKASVIFPVA